MEAVAAPEGTGGRSAGMQGKRQPGAIIDRPNREKGGDPVGQVDSVDRSLLQSKAVPRSAECDRVAGVACIVAGMAFCCAYRLMEETKRTHRTVWLRDKTKRPNWRRRWECDG